MPLKIGEGREVERREGRRERVKEEEEEEEEEVASGEACDGHAQRGGKGEETSLSGNSVLKKVVNFHGESVYSPRRIRLVAAKSNKVD